MAEAKEICQKFEDVNLIEKKEAIETDWSVEDKIMIDCLNLLEDEEKDLDKIANANHNFLLANAIKNAKKVLEEEATKNGKVSFNEEEKKKKIEMLTKVFYQESLYLLKEKLFENDE